MPPRYDALIVGAGIVGAACARDLAAGGLRVGVLERDVVGSGATAAGMGHVVVMDDSPAQLRLTHFGRTLWDDLAHDHAAAIEYSRCGTLWIAADDEEMAAVHQKQAVHADAGIAGDVLDAAALYAHEPHLHPGLRGGLLVPGDSVVYAPRAAALLLAQALDAGAKLHHGKAIALLADGVRLADGSVLHAEHVVLATGAQATALAPDLLIRPKKGHLLITDRYPGMVRHQLVELGYIKSAHAATGDSVAFNVQPRPTGQLLIGSSRQFDTTTTTVDHAILARMLTRALDYLPGLRDVSGLRVWTGFRAATPDGLPLIGPDPHRDGVWLATGHEGLGITTALATAHLLAAHLLGCTPAIPAEPYLPTRRSLISSEVQNEELPPKGGIKALQKPKLPL